MRIPTFQMQFFLLLFTVAVAVFHHAGHTEEGYRNLQIKPPVPLETTGNAGKSDLVSVLGNTELEVPPSLAGAFFSSHCWEAFDCAGFDISIPSQMVNYTAFFFKKRSVYAIAGIKIPTFPCQAKAETQDKIPAHILYRSLRC